MLELSIHPFTLVGCNDCFPDTLGFTSSKADLSLSVQFIFGFQYLDMAAKILGYEIGMSLVPHLPRSQADKNILTL